MKINNNIQSSKNIGGNIDKHSSNYENFIFLGDFKGATKLHLKHNQHCELLFFKISLQFYTSD